ncbi:helix-turn-helix transcriptional regulator, partial [Enterococcus faecalis]|nr:helix-turn-helix transcriptional regulator [Enterococcus faecalis]EIP8136652.1 helix-turn-helix transcriptional regulator [Enterococcus faecalis]EJY7249982.1 helix-turn-helix transcriptional regulator [Enterococcus faecalis]
KKEVHIGFSQYLNQYRLSEARRLLITTEEPVSTIAMNVGYSTSNHLYKNFKKLTGLSPKEFRENYRKEMAKQSLGAT